MSIMRYLRRTYIFQSIYKSPIIQVPKSYNILQKRTVDLQNDKECHKEYHKDSLQRDKSDIDKVIEENGNIYEKVVKQTSLSLNDYYRYNYTIRMLQKENSELQRENEILNEERNDLINKNNELKECLKSRFH
jgi:hypothetical protein